MWIDVCAKRSPRAWRPFFPSLSYTKISVDAPRAAKLIDSVRSGTIGPGVFGLYTDLVEFLLADDTALGKLLD